MLRKNQLLALILEPWTTLQGHQLPIRALPGTQGCAKARSGWTDSAQKTLTDLLRHASGIEGTPLGPIDFTGAWHDEEVVSVLRPAITFAVDPAGRRWVAEALGGRLGAVWCVFPDPRVIIYVAHSLEQFLTTLRRHLHFETFGAWMKRLDEAAELCWRHRGALAYQARASEVNDSRVRRWLLNLPRDARVYDLRTPTFGCGFPYGAAGPASQLHRCEDLPLFAVSGFPAPFRWSKYLGELASRVDIPRPRIMTRVSSSSAPNRPD